MRAMRLTNYWKGADGYCKSLILITKRYTLEDIKQCGKEIVLFGWFPEAVQVVTSLKEAGVFVKYVCEVGQIPSDEYKNGMPVGNDLVLKNYQELLDEAERYYFLLFSKDDKVDIWTSDLIKRVRLLQYKGVDEFGIISDVKTRDFFGDKKLEQCTYDTINEIFKGTSLYNWGAYWLCLTQAGIDVQNWDYLVYKLYKMYEDKPGRKMLEIGPGVGVCSLSLKKMLDIDVTWLTVPDDEPQWNAWRSKLSLNLYKKYDIHIKEAAVETDQFDGEYDIIFMSQVMEHFIFNPVGTIRKLMTHLKEDGVMFISVPDIIYNNPKNVESYKEIPFYEDLSVREAVRRTMINSFTHYHEYSYEEALEVFDECGLQCVDSHTNLPIHHFILKRK